MNPLFTHWEVFMLSAVLIIASAIFLVWFLWEKKHRISHPVKGGIDTSVTLPHEQEFELYHNALSLCSKKARICLDELGISYKSHHIHLIETGNYETLSRHFLKINPAGVLPALVHKGNPVYESHDIIEYAAQHSKTPELLIPKDKEKLTLMQYWSDKAGVFGEDTRPGMQQYAGNCITILTLPLFASSMSATPLRYAVMGLLFHRLKIRAVMFTLFKLIGLSGMVKIAPMMKELKTARHYMHIHLDELEKHLENSGPWLTGEQFTLADVSWVPMFERFKEADWLEYFLKDRPALAAYWQRLQGRDSYKSAILDCGHPTIDIATGWLKLKKLNNPKIKALLEAPRSISL